MTWNAFQIEALKQYERGEFEHLIENPPANVKDIGDTLLSFILIELSDSEGCEDIGTAVRRMDVAQHQITDIYWWLRRMEMEA